MNRYFLIPVTHQEVIHDESSLFEHFSIIDGNLYQKIINNGKRHRLLKSSYCNLEDMQFPNDIIVVVSENGLVYEIASCEPIGINDFSGLREISGVDVMNYYCFHPEYANFAHNFFDSYYDKKRIKDLFAK